MLITGGSGYLGRWVAELARKDWDVTASYGHKPGDLDGVAWRQLDVRDADAVTALVTADQPAVIVHTAAVNPGLGTDFEGVNVAGTANVAKAAAGVGARLVHISTDVVFDGRRGNYREEDPIRPLNEYGRSKAAAEQAVVDSGAHAVIVRTSLIYGWRPTVARAAQWMIDALDRREIVRLWSDEMRCPIWVESLANALVELASSDYTGMLHVAGAEKMSRYQFGVALLRFHGVDRGPVFAMPVPTDRPRPATARSTSPGRGSCCTRRSRV